MGFSRKEIFFHPAVIIVRNSDLRGGNRFSFKLNSDVLIGPGKIYDDFPGFKGSQSDYAVAKSGRFILLNGLHRI